MKEFSSRISKAPSASESNELIDLKTRGSSEGLWVELYLLVSGRTLLISIPAHQMGILVQLNGPIEMLTTSQGPLSTVGCEDSKKYLTTLTEIFCPHPCPWVLTAQ